jgi:hypothetical protein
LAVAAHVTAYLEGRQRARKKALRIALAALAKFYDVFRDHLAHRVAAIRQFKVLKDGLIGDAHGLAMFRIEGFTFQ